MKIAYAKVEEKFTGAFLYCFFKFLLESFLEATM
jgi:hypothetical protein